MYIQKYIRICLCLRLCIRIVSDHSDVFILWSISRSIISKCSISDTFLHITLCHDTLGNLTSSNRIALLIHSNRCHKVVLSRFFCILFTKQEITFNTSHGRNFIRRSEANIGNKMFKAQSFITNFDFRVITIYTRNVLFLMLFNSLNKHPMGFMYTKRLILKFRYEIAKFEFIF